MEQSRENPNKEEPNGEEEPMTLGDDTLEDIQEEIDSLQEKLAATGGSMSLADLLHTLTVQNKELITQLRTIRAEVTRLKASVQDIDFDQAEEVSRQTEELARADETRQMLSEIISNMKTKQRQASQ